MSVRTAGTLSSDSHQGHLQGLPPDPHDHDHRSARTPHDTHRRRRDVPRRRRGVCRGRGEASRHGNGACRADLEGSHSEVLRAWTHGHRGSRAVRRRGWLAVHGHTGSRRDQQGRRIVRNSLRRPDTLVNYPLNRYGTEEQKSKYLPMLSADTVGAYALSESGSGSDAFGLAARAEKKGDRWILNGQKLWITNGAEAGIFVVFANANPDAGYKGITAFIVERELTGFAVGKKEDKLGIR